MSDQVIPVVVTSAGVTSTPPATLQTAIVNTVTPTNPDYTSNLPASLVEDLLDTQIAGLSVIDQARVETLDSIGPLSANEWLLLQLGNMAGITQAPATNTSVYLTFSGTVGFVIVQGFTVSDGTYQYTVQTGGIIGASGQSAALYAVATQTGSWAVPSNSVTKLVTSMPSGIALSVTNALPGIPGGAAQSVASFRQAVLQAQLAVCQGMPSLLKTQLAQVGGVQANLVSMNQQASGGWEVIVGGGDPYQVGYAIYRGIGDVSALVGSVYNIVLIGAVYPALITTDKNHGYVTGQIVVMQDIVGSGNLEELNNVEYAAIVTGPTSFTVGFSPTGTYTGSGIVTPNLRNITAAINDYPDIYEAIFVNPPALTVAMTVIWNTISSFVVPAASVAQLASVALAAYVNGLEVGQPLNTIAMNDVFVEAVAGILPSNLISLLTFAVSVNGVGVAARGVLIYGEPNSTVQECYFTTNSGLITVTQS
ncbi:MAG TPA: baseplate J/gp47 family protein [Xanthobacteraceae bacterium]|nr:baseplate J/gp47 family protein [Xanthobacteraceae bacterium]